MVDCSCQQARTSKQRQNCIISNRSAPELKKKDTRSALFLFPFPPPAKSDSSRLPSDFSCQHIHPLRQNIHTAFLGSNRTLHRYDFISRRTFTVAVVQLESRAPYGPLLLGLFAQLHNSRVRLFQLALCLIFPSRLLGCPTQITLSTSRTTTTTPARLPTHAPPRKKAFRKNDGKVAQASQT